MTSRPPPIPPNRDYQNHLESQKKSPLDKVEKINPVDEDETRKSPFRQMVDKQDEEPALLDKPTPFELFNSSKAAKPSEISQTATSNAATQEQPLATSTNTTSTTTVQSSQSSTYSSSVSMTSDSGSTMDLAAIPTLPESSEFWEASDAPPDMLNAGPSFQETMYPTYQYSQTSSEGSDTGDQSEGNSEGVTQEETPATTQLSKGKEGQAAQGKGQKKTEATPTTKTASLKDEEKEKQAEALVPYSEKKGIDESKPSTTEKGKVVSEKKDTSSQNETLPYKDLSSTVGVAPKVEVQIQEKRIEKEIVDQKKLTAEKEVLEKGPAVVAVREEKKGETTRQGTATSYQGMGKGETGQKISQPQDKDSSKDQSDDQKKEDRKNIQIVSPTLTPLHPDVVAPAQAATTQAAPFLSPETMSLYFQMIGSIMAMVKPNGDNMTEFVLNSPSFSQSRFYGAKITIEKFATAPDQLNIRLTGSNQAVDAFNQNIPALMNAFQKGNYAFQINRLDTAYEKLEFHRKEKPKGNQ